MSALHTSCYISAGQTEKITSRGDVTVLSGGMSAEDAFLMISGHVHLSDFMFYEGKPGMKAEFQVRRAAGEQAVLQVNKNNHFKNIGPVHLSAVDSLLWKGASLKDSKNDINCTALHIEAVLSGQNTGYLMFSPYISGDPSEDIKAGSTIHLTGKVPDSTRVKGFEKATIGTLAGTAGTPEGIYCGDAYVGEMDGGRLHADRVEIDRITSASQITIHSHTQHAMARVTIKNIPAVATIEVPDGVVHLKNLPDANPENPDQKCAIKAARIYIDDKRPESMNLLKDASYRQQLQFTGRVYVHDVEITGWKEGSLNTLSRKNGPKLG